MPLSVPAQHANFEKFLKSDEIQMEYKNFKSLSDARDFCQLYQGIKQTCSTTMTAEGTGKNAYVTIIKTKGLYNTNIEGFTKCQASLNRLRDLLERNTAGEVFLEKDNSKDSDEESDIDGEYMEFKSKKVNSKRSHQLNF